MRGSALELDHGLKRLLEGPAVDVHQERKAIARAALVAVEVATLLAIIEPVAICPATCRAGAVPVLEELAIYPERSEDFGPLAAKPRMHVFGLVAH